MRLGDDLIQILIINQHSDYGVTHTRTTALYFRDGVDRTVDDDSTRKKRDISSESENSARLAAEKRQYMRFGRDTSETPVDQQDGDKVVSAEEGPDVIKRGHYMRYGYYGYYLVYYMRYGYYGYYLVYYMRYGYYGYYLVHYMRYGYYGHYLVTSPNLCSEFRPAVDCTLPHVRIMIARGFLEECL